MYVEDLAGGGNHVEIFSASNGLAEWPVGWRDGDLIVAVGPTVVQNTFPNPYNAGNSGTAANDAYHVVDPATGNRLAVIGSDCSFGPLTLAGTGCSTTGGAANLMWDGQRRSFVRPADVAPGPVSPDGTQMAGMEQRAPFVIDLLSASGRSASGANGNPLGWIDATHLVFATLNGTNDVGNAVLDTTSRKITSIDTGHQALTFFGGLPGGLSATDHFTCRLPFGGLIDTSQGGPARVGGFINFPGATFEPDARASLRLGGPGGFVTSTTPQLNGGDAETYDTKAHRWLPTRLSLVAPDGSSYAYDEPSGLHVVDVASGADRRLPGTDSSERSFYPLAYTAKGIYAMEGPLQTSPSAVPLSLWLVDATSGHQTQLGTPTNGTTVVHEGALWTTMLSQADAHPWQQSPYDSPPANDELVRVALDTGVSAIWFGRPGTFVGPVGFDKDGHPVVVVVNSAVSQLWLVRGPEVGQQIYAGPGAYSSANRMQINHVLQVGTTDGRGIWFVNGNGGVVLYTPAGGVELVFGIQSAGRIAGPCVS
jgi:hypothetical protein